MYCHFQNVHQEIEAKTTWAALLSVLSLRAAPVSKSDIITRHSLVWHVTKFAVFFLCPVTDISSTVAPIGVKFSMIVPDTASPILEAASLGDPQNSKFWA